MYKPGLNVRKKTTRTLRTMAQMSAYLAYHEYLLKQDPTDSYSDIEIARTMAVGPRVGEYGAVSTFIPRNVCERLRIELDG